MNRLKLYLKGKSRLVFAEQIGTTKNYVNLLAANFRRPSPELALKIEKATNGEITRDMLLFPELYPLTETKKHNKEKAIENEQ